MTKARDIASAIPAPSTVSSAELGYLDGVTSAIQTQIDTKAPSSTAVTLTGTQTLTNKTLTSPVIASVVNNTLTSTTGDMIYASAANTPARLGIGSSAQVLTVASGVPSWATPAAGGGMTLLTTHSLSGSTSTISSISGSYKSLVGIMFGATANGSNTNWKIDPNGSTLITNTVTLEGTGTTTTNFAYTATWYLGITNIKVAGGLNCWSFTIDNYASTTSYKPVKMSGQFMKTGDDLCATNNGGGIQTTSAITSLNFVTLSGSWTAGTVLLYGVN